MSPRSDVFAFGALLYEMLSGRRAFQGESMADTVAAILSCEPIPLPDLGIEIPAGLQAILRRCLEKHPGDRFASGHDLALVLEAMSQTHVAPRGQTRRLVVRLVATAALVVGAGLALVVWASWLVPRGFGIRDRAAPAKSASLTTKAPRVAVAVFENRTGDPSLDVVGLMTADWITDGLAQIGTANVALPPSSALGTGGAGDPAARAAYADPRRVAEVTGASVVVSGTYEFDADQLVVRARLSEAGSGRVIAALEPVRGPREPISEVVQATNQAVAGAVAFHLDAHYDLRSERPPSIEVYREISQAASHWYRDWDAVLGHLERARELDPQYARPRLLLAMARFFAGDYRRAKEELDALAGAEGRLSEWERVDLRRIRAHMEGQTWESLVASREMAALAPGATEGPYNVGVMLYLLNHPVEAEAALAALAMRQTRFGWAVSEIRLHALHLAGRFGEQVVLASEARERLPTMLYFHEHEAAALAAMGRTDDVNRTVTEALTTQASSGTPGLVMLVTAMELRAHGRRNEADRMAVRAVEWYGAQTLDRFLALQTPNRGVEWYRSRPPDIKKRLREEHAMALGLAGRWDDVHAMVSQLAKEDLASVDYMGWLGVLAARRGDHAEARRVAERLRALGRQYVFGSDTYWRACIAAQLGQKQQAVDLLTQAFSEGYWFQTQLHRTVDLEPLWDFAPFRELLRPKG